MLCKETPWKQQIFIHKTVQICHLILDYEINIIFRVSYLHNQQKWRNCLQMIHQIFLLGDIQGSLAAEYSVVLCLSDSQCLCLAAIWCRMSRFAKVTGTLLHQNSGATSVKKKKNYRRKKNQNNELKDTTTSLKLHFIHCFSTQLELSITKKNFVMLSSEVVSAHRWSSFI